MYGRLNAWAVAQQSSKHRSPYTCDDKCMLRTLPRPGGHSAIKTAREDGTTAINVKLVDGSHQAKPQCLDKNLSLSGKALFSLLRRNDLRHLQIQ